MSRSSALNPRFAPLARSVEAFPKAARRSSDAPPLASPHRGGVIWLTGLSGSGKTTLATGVQRACAERGWRAIVLDGDRFRQGVSADLGFSAEDRLENIRRAAEVAALLAQSGLLVVAAFISPTREVRALARRLVEQAGAPFAEVYLSASLDACEARDVKQLYARARAGLLAGLTGVAAPFEPPEAPDLRIDTGLVSYDDALAHLLDHVVAVATR